MMANLITIQEDSQFQPKVDAAGPKLVVVDFNASWCQPCRNIAPVFASLAKEHSNAVFLKVDVDVCKATAERYSVRSMPTFIFLKGGVKVDEMRGADEAGLKQRVKQYYDKPDDGDEGSGVPGYIDLNSLMDKQQTECLNESDDHRLEGCLRKDGSYLESDCDEQLIIAMSFNQKVKVHSMKIMGPETNGPKVVKLFINRPKTLSFDEGEQIGALQQFELTKEQLAGEIIPLRFVKFQNVQNINVFVQNNQEDEDTTRIDYFCFIGAPLNTTNMGEFKRVAGKKGESH